MKRRVHQGWGAAPLLCIALALAACGGGSSPVAEPDRPPVSDPDTDTTPGVQLFTAAAAPAKLSAWKLLLSDGQRLSLQAGALPYGLNTPLFSDYAHKFRTLWLPAETRIDYRASGPLQFPVGAILTKSFFYPRTTTQAAGAVGARQTEQLEGGETIDLRTHRLLETRLMVREVSGQWGAVTYVWDDDQRDASLVRAGRNIPVELENEQGARTSFIYAVPTDAQCVACHVTNVSAGRFEAIGPQADNMNRRYTYAAGETNQLDHLVDLGMLAGYTVPAPTMPVWNDTSVSLASRARAYLDVNCASCHNSAGRSGNTGLWLGLEITEPLRLGICKPPAGGQRHNQFAYDVTPGNADVSFLYYRISNYRIGSDPARVAMPELGRHVLHQEGNALVSEWIRGMTPGCP